MKCRYCGSDYVKRFGVRHNRSGNKQMFICRYCGRKFSEDNGFLKMRHSKEIITMCLDLYYKGLSFRKIQDHLKQFHNLDVSDVTVLRWIRKYSKLIKRYTDTLKIKEAEKIHMDETMLYSNCGASVAWAALDSKSRFLVGFLLSQSRYVEYSRELIKQCNDRVIKPPKFVVTDGYAGYTYPLRDMMPKTIHKRYTGLTDRKINNSKVERFNGVLKSRTKVTNGFKTFESAEAILNGWQIYYNFIKPHVSLGGITPAEKCGIGADGGNKWLDLIGKSVKT